MPAFALFRYIDEPDIFIVAYQFLAENSRRVPNRFP